MRKRSMKNKLLSVMLCAALAVSNAGNIVCAEETAGVYESSQEAESSVEMETAEETEGSMGTEIYEEAEGSTEAEATGETESDKEVESSEEFRDSKEAVEMQSSEETEETAEPAVDNTADIASGKSNNVSWVIDANGKLTITGSGDWEKDYTLGTAPWYSYADKIVEASVQLSGTTNAMCMFYQCKNLKKIDLSKFNTSKVTNVYGMFAYCSSLTELDLSNFVTGNVTNMHSMFNGCSSLTKLNLSKFNTKKATDMGSMFEGCSSLTELDLSNFDTSNVTKIDWIFWDCKNLKKLDVSSFKTSKIDRMASVFNGCSSLTELDLSSFDTSNVKSMSNMFKGCSSLTKLNISSYDTRNVVYMGGMFRDCERLESLDLSNPNPVGFNEANFNTGNVTDMAQVFYGCKSLKRLDISKFKTAKVTNMEDMFHVCSSLTTFDLSGFDTGKVTDMGRMFDDCTSLKTLDLSGFKTGSVTDMSYLFGGCENLETLNISSFDTGNVQNMNCMFYRCKKLKSLNLNSFNTDNVLNMSYMFNGCESLDTLNLNSFNTKKTKNISLMFMDCSKLKELDLSGFELSGITNEQSSGVLLGCRSLEKIDAPIKVTTTIEMPYIDNKGHWIRTDTNESITTLPKGLTKSILLTYSYDVEEEESSEAESSEREESSENESSEREESSEIESSAREESSEIESSEREESSEEESSEREESSEIESSEREESSESESAETEPSTEPGEIKGTLDISGITDMTYTGKAIKQSPRVYYNGSLLTEGKDYTLSYKNNVNAGNEAMVTVKTKGSLTGSVTKSFAIKPRSITDSGVIIEDAAYTFDKKAHKKAPKITYNGKALKEGRDFEVVDYGKGDYTAAGTYMMKIKGIGNFTGTCSNVKVVIVDKNQNIGRATVTKIAVQEYQRGKAVTLDDSQLTVRLGGVELRNGTDYTVSYVNNTDPGKATVVIKGKNEYAGTKYAYFTIRRTPVAITENMVTNRKAIANVVMQKGGCTPDPVLVSEGDTLVKGTDYTISYRNNKKAGATASMIIRGKGNFKGSLTIPFTIMPKDISDRTMTVRIADVPYTGKANHYQSKPVITDSDGKTLALKKDYTIEGYSAYGKALGAKSNPDNGTTITVTIRGKGSYTGTTTASYEVRGIRFANAVIKINPQNYTGHEITLKASDFASATIKVGKVKKPLTYGTDYEVVSYKNNIRKGTATVILRGKGDYAGEKAVSFKINTSKIN